MKSMLLASMIASCLLAPASGTAQIPNGGFETWANDAPANWFSNSLPGFAATITQTASAHSGTSALQASVVAVDIGGFMFSSPPLLFTGFNIAQRYTTFSGWYTFTPFLGDSLYGWMLVYKQSQAIGSAVLNERITRSSYREFTVAIDYFTDDVPDSCAIWFAIAGTEENGDTVHVGSNFKIDDLALTGGTAGVEAGSQVPISMRLQQNYPNPFNPSTRIQLTIADRQWTTVNVYDVLGREVATLLNEVKEPGTYTLDFNGSGLPSGAYVYRLRAGSFVQSKTMLLLK